MKKAILVGGMIVSASLFAGCACKTDCGMEQHCNQTHNNTKCHVEKDKCQAKHSRSSSCITTPVVKTQKSTTCVTPKKVEKALPKSTPVLKPNKVLRISVVGQGVAPRNTISPAQAYALAKRAAIADAYRLIAEKVKGVYVEGDDFIKNMMVKRSTVRTSVNATVKNANIVETTFKEGLCEVEMEIKLSYSQFAQ